MTLSTCNNGFWDRDVDDTYCKLSFAYVTAYILSERPERDAWLAKLQDLSRGTTGSNQ